MDGSIKLPEKRSTMSTVRMTLTIDKNVLERLKLQAQEERRSLSNLVTVILDEWLEAQEDKKKGGK